MNIMHLRSSGGFFGAEGVIIGLANKLEQTHYNNFIVVIDNVKNSHTELVSEAKKSGLRSESVPCRGRFDIRTISAIRSLVRKYKINVLHCHDYKANLYGFLASRFLGVKLVATNHLWTSETAILRLYESIDAIMMNFFNMVVAVSDEVAAQLRPALLFNRQKIAVIYNGIDFDKYTPDNNGEKIRNEFKLDKATRIIGSVGRLSPQKGFGYLLGAARKVIEKMPKTVFLIVGDGDLIDELKNKAEDLGIRDNVIFTGKRSDMADIYAAMDIFVLSSLREGLPLVILEALAMKKPVIATDVGGVSGVISDQESGILVKPGDIDGLSGAISQLLIDENRADKLTTNGNRFVMENFSAKKMAEQYGKLYEEVVKR